MTKSGFSANKERPGLASMGVSSVWMLVSLALAIPILYGVYMTMLYGEAAHGTNIDVPWGILIAAYIFFVVSSTGLCLISSLGHVFGYKNFEMIAKRSVMLAMITLLIGFIMIGMDLGVLLNFYWVMLSPNLQSAIWWMGTLYSVYLVFLLLEFRQLSIGNHKGAAYMGLGAFIAGIAAHSNLGAVFGYLAARPFWTGPYLPIYFILSALASGSALVIIIMHVANHGSSDFSAKARETLIAITRLFGLFLGITIFFYFWKVVTGLQSGVPGNVEAVMLMLTGPLAFKFWVFEVLMGMLLPFVAILVTKAQNLRVSFWAALSAMFGIFFMRFGLVITGEILPSVPGYGLEIAPYSPTSAEIAIVVGGIGLCAFLYLLAERLFDLGEVNP